MKKTIGILAFTQVVSWGSLYYAFTILAPQIQHETGWRPEVIYGAFSWALLVAGLASPGVGMLLDRFGGRPVMGAGSLTCAAGFALLASSHSTFAYFAAWSVLGLAMAMVLYEAAFATLNHVFPVGTRNAISTLTLFGGFASTVFWPLTLALSGAIGWRDTYLLYGAVQLLMCAPLHGAMARPVAAVAHLSTDIAADAIRDYSLREAMRHPTFWKLAFAFAANSFVFSALSVHLIPLLRDFGHPTGLAVFLAATIGPMQVAGRIGERMFGRAAAPQAVGRITFGSLPLALAFLLLLGAQPLAAGLFCVLYGLSNGILTIVRGTIPQALFGRENYGAISGAMAGPALLAKAAGPLVIAVAVQHAASPALIIGGLLVAAMVSLACYVSAVRSAGTVVGRHDAATRDGIAAPAD